MRPIAQSRTRDLIVGAVATVYGLWLCYAAELSALLLATILFAPATLVYIMARVASAASASSPRREPSSQLAIAAAAIYAIYALVRATSQSDAPRLRAALCASSREQWQRKFGVHSEVGKLRTVMVCRPGLAHQRLTPGNCHDLLFDDVIWVHEAQKDHYDFVLKMQERGVEVLELHDLLAETLEDKEARALVLDRRITANAVGTAGPRRSSGPGSTRCRRAARRAT